MLKYFLVLILFVSLEALASPTNFFRPKIAEVCSAEKCQLPSCQCASTNIPGGLNSNEIPQLVMITFDDAVNTVNFNYYKRAFFDKTNPDGCPISTTYYVSHEYTDYSKVHELHAKGHEIALHSITHTTMTQYWKDITKEAFLQEFGDEKQLIAHFANISVNDIQGMRLPFLQMSGETSFEAMSEVGIVYDSSWPTLKHVEPALWPFTLDYLNVPPVDCPIGPCPVESHPGLWEQPMVDWFDDSGRECAMVDACANIPDNGDGVLQFMIRNFNRHYNGNKAPFGVFLHASWFMLNEANFDGFLKFIDYLQTLDDVYIVSVSRALEWSKNPQKLGDLQNVWPSCQNVKPITCSSVSCQLKKGNEDRWMTHCQGTCPNVYPWLGNPLGQ